MQSRFTVPYGTDILACETLSSTLSYGVRHGRSKVADQRVVMKHECKHRGRPKIQADTTQREAIVATARMLFLQKGYGATTTEDIVGQCRISKQTLYRLFPGKATLFAAVVVAGREQWLNLPVPDDLPLETALEKIFRLDISEGEERERLQQIQMTLAEAQLHPELREIVKYCGSDQAHEQLAAWLQGQAERGRLRVVGDALATAQMLTDMVFGALLRRTIGNVEWRSGEDWRAHVKAAIGVFLHGVGTRAERQ